MYGRVLEGLGFFCIFGLKVRVVRLWYVVMLYFGFRSKDEVIRVFFFILD